MGKANVFYYDTNSTPEHKLRNFTNKWLFLEKLLFIVKDKTNSI